MADGTVRDRGMGEAVIDSGGLQRSACDYCSCSSSHRVQAGSGRLCLRAVTGRELPSRSMVPVKPILPLASVYITTIVKTQ